MVNIKTKRHMRPSFLGLPCQYRKAALVLKKLMKRNPLPFEVALRNAAVSPASVRQELELIELAALDAITRGHGTWRRSGGWVTPSVSMRCETARWP